MSTRNESTKGGLTRDGCYSRCLRLWGSLPDTVEVALVSSPEHLSYFANYYQSPFRFNGNHAAAVLVLERRGTNTLFIDSKLRPYADHSYIDELQELNWYDGVHSAGVRRSVVADAVCEFLKERTTAGSLALEPDSAASSIISGLTAQHPNLTQHDISPLILQLRRKKDADELTLLRRAIAAAEAAYLAAMEQCRPGMTELELYQLMHTAAALASGEQVVLYGDILSGERCIEHVGTPTTRVIEKGDLVLLDFSVVMWNYRGDFAGTFLCESQATELQQSTHNACRQAIEAVEEILAPGLPAKRVYHQAVARLQELGVAQFHRSHIGHGLGVGHPEAPFFVPESSDTVLEGDVVAVEVALYPSVDASMRLEHNYLITADGNERLSQHPLVLCFENVP